jgi:hypothetical protein
VRADSLDVVASDCEVVAEAEPETPPSDTTSDTTTDPPAEGTMTPPPSGDGGDKQTQVFSDCRYWSDNPHRSTYRGGTYHQAAAKGHTHCSDWHYRVYASSDFYRWRWYHWRWLDTDSDVTAYGYNADTNARWGCNYKLTTRYKVWTYHRTTNLIGYWSDANSSNESDKEIRC